MNMNTITNVLFVELKRTYRNTVLKTHVTQPVTVVIIKEEHHIHGVNGFITKVAQPKHALAVIAVKAKPVI